MLIILASRDDASAHEIARSARRDDVAVMTADDLLTGGWAWKPGAIRQARLRLGGRPLRARAIRGVIVRIPAISVGELPMIEEDDRSFLAGEMTAMLAAFLSELCCPVLNRPSPTRFDGPAWSDERWRSEARRFGLRTVPPAGVRPGVEPGVGAETATTRHAAMLGSRWFGRVPADVRRALSRMAESLGVRALSARFAVRDDGMALDQVATIPKIDTVAKRDALWDFFGGNTP